MLQKLQNWPPEETINWSALGREFNIPNKKKGQIVKEFTKENRVDVYQLDYRPANSQLRRRKLRMPGGQVSVPTHRTVEGVKQDWNSLIELGELSLGEPCYTHTLIKCVVKDGELTQTETTVYGRKISLLDILCLALSQAR